MDTIYYGTIISVITILVNLLISLRTIHTNRDIQKENAGKNRVIYDTEQMNISQDNKVLKKELKDMLNSGNYTVLSAFVNLGNTTETRYVLGKIKP